MDIKQITNNYNHEISKRVVSRAKLEIEFQDAASYRDWLKDLITPKRVRNKIYEQDSN